MGSRLSLTFLFALAGACSFDPTGLSGDEGGPAPDASRAPGDGGTGEVCAQEGDCDAGVCDVDEGRCVACLDDGDCGAESACEDNRCVDFERPRACAGETVDLDSDPEHCGACGNACGEGTTGSCVQGHCESAASCDEDQTDDFGGGDGSAGDPYLICNRDQLEILAGSEVGEHLESHFLLTRSLDLADRAWVPVGDDETFEGRFDGNHYEISNFEIVVSSDRSGLFARVGEGGEVRNVALVDALAVGDDDTIGLLAGCNDGLVENASARGDVEGEEEVGGLIGRHEGILRAASADVDVTGTEKHAGALVGRCDDGVVSRSHTLGSVEGEEEVGGLIGRAEGECVIRDSRADGDVTAGGRRAGGLVGQLRDDAGVERSAATGAVTHDDDDESIGGLVGRMRNSDTFVRASFSAGDVQAEDAEEVGGLIGLVRRSALVADSYATGSVDGDDDVGGLIGKVDDSDARIERNYAIGLVSGDDDVGGLIGDNESEDTVTASYWWLDGAEDDDQVEESDGGEPLTTAEFGDVARFEGWDFGATWAIRSGHGPPVDQRPRLHWQGAP